MRGNPPAITFAGGEIAMPAVRSLGRAGIEVHAVGGDPAYDPEAYSRYCSSYTNLGSGDGVVERWLRWLADRAPEGAVLLPCCDEGLELILRHGEALERLGHVPMECNREVVPGLLDKQRTHDLACQAGVSAPRTVTPRTEAELDEAVAEIGFPCAIKPVHSHLFAQVFGIDNKLLIAHDRRELTDGLERMLARGLEMTVTEIIPGPETELLSHCGYLDERGEPLTQFTFRKIRQFPIGFGLGCYVVSDWNEEVVGEGLRFLRGIGLRGPFHVEFKRDPRDGQLKLLECNHRFTVEAIYSPVDLALLSYNRALGRPPPPERPYREGVHLWGPMQDLRSFRSYRRRGELSLGGWIRSLIHRQRLYLFSWSDPLPAIRFHLAGLGRLVRRWLRRRPHEPQSQEPLLAPRS